MIKQGMMREEMRQTERNPAVKVTLGIGGKGRKWPPRFPHPLLLYIPFTRES